ncbi:MAG: BamA/TamA family outer membrane protein, partial [Polyangiaceae bacterium]|nr:BamA/TamA family outer membrane protein [Polyangiaceae bacterium]
MGFGSHVLNATAMGRAFPWRLGPQRGRQRALAQALLLTVLAGCSTVPRGRLAVDRVDILENEDVSENEIEAKIATAPSPRFLGIWDGVAFEYEYLDKFVLQSDIARVERLYRARGYYDAKVRAGRVIPTEEGHVRVEIVVDEGPPVVVESIEPKGLETVPFQDQAAVLNAMGTGLSVGQRFDEERYEATKATVRTVLTDRGFAWAQVKGQVQVNLIANRARVVVEVDAGPSFKVRSVAFKGIDEELPEPKIARMFGVKAGDTFCTEELDQGKLALLDLGIFAGVEVSWPRSSAAQVKQGKVQVPTDSQGHPAVDVVVTVTPAPLRAVKLGAGSELDVIRTDLHAVLGWESRNFLGGLRRFSITARPGVVLYPTRVPTFESPQRLLPEGRLTADLRHPGVLIPRAVVVLRGNASIRPVLLTRDQTDLVLGYRELTGALGIERAFWDNRIVLGAFVNAQIFDPFTYVGILDADLDLLFVRYFELIANLNLRDDPVRPHKGVFWGNNVQLAGGVLGGSVDDVKVQPDLRLYVPISRTVTFAVRGTIGLLFPTGYGQSLENPMMQGATRDQQKLYFRAFYSGGPGSNRGYPYRGVGPHGAVGFLSPDKSAQQLSAECNPFDDNYREERCKVPLGGLTLWEASAEVRFPVYGPLRGAVFGDASDVTRQRTTFHFEYLHFSTGAGLRYDTP